MSLAACALLVSGLWPFARELPPPADPTVADAIAPDAAPGRPPPAADAAAAAAAYAAFLDSPAAADPALKLTALRRLADLELEAAEAVLVEGGEATLGLENAIGLYRRLLAEYGRAETGWQDHWRYQLARAEAMAGREALAETELSGLVAASPDSPLAPEAWFRIGESRFLARDWPAAEQAYGASLALAQDGPFAEQARYKLGWALFKQARHEESFAPFAGVVDARLADADPASLDRAGRELVDDSLRAMAIGFAAQDGPDSAARWLASGSPPGWAWLAWSRLGELYLEQERWTDAAAAFGDWARRAPAHERAPELSGRAIDALLAGGFSGEALEAMAGYAESFAGGGPWWAGRAAAAYPGVRERLKDCLDQLAAHHHAAFQAGTAGGGAAAHWYRRWLDEFPDDAQAPERHFLLAELYYGAGHTAEAAEAYHAVAYGYPAHARAAEAGFAAVVARRDLAGMDAGAEPALIAEERAFFSAFPADPRAADVQVDAAERLLARGELAEAWTVSRELLARADAPAGARSAALLVSGHAGFDLGDHAAAEADYANWLADNGEAALAESVRERLAASIYEQGRMAAAAGEGEAAMAHYLRVAEVVPGSPVAAVGHNDAAALAFAAGDWARAADICQAFIARWPGHELADAAQLSLAAALVSLGDARRAGPALAAVSRLPGQPEDTRRVAAWQAAEQYGATGDAAATAAALEDYLARFPEPADAALEARLQLADLAGEGPLRRHWLGEIVAAHRAAGETASARSRTLAAQASLELAGPAVADFEALALALPLESSVPEKARRMEAALAALGEAAAYGVSGVSTEATFRMAETYRGMGSALMDSARPAGLDAETLEQYELLLEEQAFPFEEQAIALHEANAARTRDGLYDRWVVQSFEALAVLVPARWKRNETGESLVQLDE